MTAPMFMPVDPPGEATTPGMGLLATVSPDYPAGNWPEGVAWTEPAVGLLQLIDPCDPDPPAFPDDTDTRSRVVFARSMSFRTRYWWQGRPQDFDDAAAESFARSMSSAAVARELWTGEGTQARPYLIPRALGGTTSADHTNAYLADGDSATVVGGGPYAPAEALALLDGFAHRALQGTRTPVLHCTPEVLAMAAQYLTVTGSTVRTINGSVVVADAGYPGTGPADATGQWAYATGPVGVRLSPINTETAPTATVEHQYNRRTVWADRTFQVGFDAGCHLAIRVDLALPTLTAPSGG